MKVALGVAVGMSIGMFAALVATYAGASPVPAAHAQAGPGPGAGAGSDVVMGTGGSTNNQNDLCWLFFKDKSFKGEDRYVLCLYKATGSGNNASFDLADVREVTYDCKVAQLNTGNHDKKVSPQAMRDAYEKAKKDHEESERKRKAEEKK